MISVIRLKPPIQNSLLLAALIGTIAASIYLNNPLPLLVIPLLSAVETVNLTINTTEVRSINDIATVAANRISQFANKYQVGEQFDQKRMEEDLIFFMVKRGTLGLTQLEVHVLEDGQIGVGEFSGRRKATLVLRFNYIGRGYKP